VDVFFFPAPISATGDDGLSIRTKACICLRWIFRVGIIFDQRLRRYPSALIARFFLLYQRCQPEPYALYCRRVYIASKRRPCPLTQVARVQQQAVTKPTNTTIAKTNGDVGISPSEALCACRSKIIPPHADKLNARTTMIPSSRASKRSSQPRQVSLARLFLGPPGTYLAIWFPNARGLYSTVPHEQ